MAKNLSINGENCFQLSKGEFDSFMNDFFSSYNYLHKIDENEVKGPKDLPNGGADRLFTATEVVVKGSDKRNVIITITFETSFNENGESINSDGGFRLKGLVGLQKFIQRLAKLG